jgi:hypothetical protein
MNNDRAALITGGGVAPAFVPLASGEGSSMTGALDPVTGGTPML